MKIDSYIIHPGKLEGVINIPSSKSDGQRAILAATLSSGKSILYNVGKSSDELNMLRIIVQMGAKVTELDGGQIEITGSQCTEFSGDFHIGESGLGLRLLTSVLATKATHLTISGEGTLLKRPMNWFKETLPSFGIDFNSTNGHLPFELKGPMQSNEIEVDGSQSSQYISGLLMALPLLEGTSRLKIENLNSLPYVQMTLNTLNKFGITIEHKDFKEFIIPGAQNYLPCDYTIEGDWSSASYWLIASALGANISVKGLSMSSLQADKKILDAFVSAGCSISHSGQGLSVDGENRHHFSFDATHCPDLFPALVTFAALIPGDSRIKGLLRLKHKESDRGKTLQSEFKKLGVQIDLEDDVMIIHGGNTLNGGHVSSHHDHRIAMCLAIAGKFAENSVMIENPEAVSKSYADFWEHLNLVTANS